MKEENRELVDAFERTEQAFSRYASLIPKTDDLSLIVLKGHLIIEEILYNLLLEHCGRPKHLEKAKLRFSQLMWVLRSVVKPPIIDMVWETISIINSLRNKLSHNLEPKDLSKYISSLKKLTVNNMKIKPEGYKPPNTPVEITTTAIYFVLGQLQVITSVNAFAARMVSEAIGNNSNSKK